MEGISHGRLSDSPCLTLSNACWPTKPQLTITMYTASEFPLSHLGWPRRLFCSGLIDLSLRTPLSTMFQSHSYSTVADLLPSAAAELILQSDAEAKVVCLSKPLLDLFQISSPFFYRSFGKTFRPTPVVVQHFLSCSVAIAKG